MTGSTIPASSFDEADLQQLAKVIELPIVRPDRNYQFIKRSTDIIFAVIAIIFLLPALLMIAMITKYTSPGTIFYNQTRVGKNGRPFTIYKFRSMYQNAEKNGPQLWNENDPRVTAWGRCMRKWKLDELPQLWNVLKGDMSLVGPRPERAFYLQQMRSINVLTDRLTSIRPGLTSAGMVRFGYASNIDEMLERMIADLHYLHKASFAMDIRIIFLTLITIISGRSK